MTSLLLAIFLYGQVNAALHFVVVDHDYCAEHATATGHGHSGDAHEGDDHESDDHSDNDHGHSEKEDCQVMALLSHASADKAQETTFVPSGDIFVADAAIQADLIQIVQADLFFLSPSTSPPTLLI